jgi:O-antigen/teichoic acid export membrane protein
MAHESVGVARGILRNASALFLVGLFAKGAGLIIAILVARFLGPGAMGLFAALFSVAVLIETFISLGMSDSLVRDVAAQPARAAQMFRAALKLVALVSIVPAAGLAIAAWFADEQGAARASLLILAVGTPISGAFVVAQAIFQGAERVLTLTWVTFVARIVSLAFLFAVFYGGAGIEAAFASRVLFHFLSIVAFAWLLRMPTPDSPDSPRSMRELMTRSMPFAANKAIRETGLRLPSLLLPGTIGLAAAGLFDSANRIRSTVAMTMSASIVGLMPALARNAAGQEQGTSLLIGYSVKYMCIAMSLVATLVALLSEELVLLLFGGSFVSAALPLQLLAWTQVLNGMSAVLQQSMLAQGAVGAAIRNSAIALAIQAGLLVALSPVLGVPGAAFAVLISSAIAVAVDLYAVRSRVASIELRRFVFAPLAAALLVACALYWASGLPLWIRLFATLGSWIVATALFRIVPREELHFMGRLVRLPGSKKTRSG